MVRITKEELLEKLFHEDYEQLKGKKLRITRLRIPGKEVCLAHVISPPSIRTWGYISVSMRAKTIRANPSA